jgi:hypothetical protein
MEARAIAVIMRSVRSLWLGSLATLKPQTTGAPWPRNTSAAQEALKLVGNRTTTADRKAAGPRRYSFEYTNGTQTIEDLIDNVGKVTLGLSVSCARCHDHKFDPIPTRDYYGLYGIFQSTKYAFPGTEIYPHAKDFVPLTTGRDAERLKNYQKETSGLDDRIEDFTAGREGKGLSKEEKDKEMARMKDEGRIEVIRERGANYHVFAFIDGQRPRDDLITASLEEAGGPEKETNHAAKTETSNRVVARKTRTSKSKAKKRR